MTRYRFLWLAIILLGGALIALWAGSRPAPVAASRADLPIRVVITSDIRGTNPGVTRDGNTDAVLHHVVESLVAYRENLSVAPLVAQRFDVSPDHRSYRFVLRDGLRFHNGAPVTSAEVKWSWLRMLDDKTGFRCRSWYDGSDKAGFGAKIVAIDTPDPKTVIFRLDRPNSAFLDQMASLQCITAILHPDSVARDGSWIAPIGTGPYRIARWQRGEYIELRRFAGYHPRPEPADGYAGGRRALAERVRFMIVPEPSVGQSALQAGDIDILPRVPAYLIAHAKVPQGTLELPSEQLYWNVLLVQTRDPLFSDVRMRRALAYAIDGAQVAAITTYGASKANPSAVPRISPFHSKAQNIWWPYDPARARALLAAAGYNGQPVHIQTNRKFPFMFDNAVAVQAMLVAAGIDARLEVLDWATHLANYVAGDFQLSIFSYSARAHPVLSYAAFIGSKDLNSAAQWDDPAARRLLRASVEADTPAAQQRMFDQLHALMFRDVPIIGLYNENSVDLVRPDIKGYRNSPLGHPRLWGVSRVVR